MSTSSEDKFCFTVGYRFYSKDNTARDIMSIAEFEVTAAQQSEFGLTGFGTEALNELGEPFLNRLIDQCRSVADILDEYRQQILDTYLDPTEETSDNDD